MKTKPFPLAVLLLAVALSLISCSKDTPGPNEVYIRDNTFDLQTIAVSAGSTVIWTNMEKSSYSVDSDNNLFKSDNIETGKSFCYTFSTIGTYKYHCKLHPGMTGTIIVN
ncbi:MAG: cupredoxin domain-containing protein [Bacteroidales bacterium]